MKQNAQIPVASCRLRVGQQLPVNFAIPFREANLFKTRSHWLVKTSFTPLFCAKCWGLGYHSCAGRVCVASERSGSLWGTQNGARVCFGSCPQARCSACCSQSFSHELEDSPQSLYDILVTGLVWGAELCCTVLQFWGKWLCASILPLH